MRTVWIESPFAGDIEANLTYARACLRDCILRGEAPIASHLLYTQPGVLNDNDPSERKLGMQCGFTWNKFAEACVVYTDRGISGGMEKGIEVARVAGIRVEYRQLGPAA